MEAGLEVFGTSGYAGSSVRGVSATAGLNSRYFYESFSGREELLFAVYQRILVEILTRATHDVSEAGTIEDKARAGLRAGWEILTEDPRKARIVALEVIGVSENLEKLRRDMRHALAKLTADQALLVAGPNVRLVLDPFLVARSLIGGVVELLGDWIHGDIDASVDEVVEHLTRLFTAAAYAAIEFDDPESGPR